MTMDRFIDHTGNYHFLFILLGLCVTSELTSSLMYLSTALSITCNSSGRICTESALLVSYELCFFRVDNYA